MTMFPKRYHGDELKCGGPQMCSDCRERYGRGTQKPEGNNRFKSKIDGLYYNSYPSSPDAAEDYFGVCMKEIANKIKKDLLHMGKLRLQEAKDLQEWYKRFDIKECWCAEASTAECPSHIDSYIEGLEREASKKQ